MDGYRGSGGEVPIHDGPRNSLPHIHLLLVVHRYPISISPVNLVRGFFLCGDKSQAW